MADYGNFDIRVPRITVTFTGPTGAYADFDISLPLYETDFTGYNQTATFAVEVPLAFVEFTGTVGQGNFAIEIPSIQGIFSGGMSGGNFVITLRQVKVEFEGGIGKLGQFNIALPRLQVDFSGVGLQEGNFDAVLPILQVDFEGGGISYLCLVLNNEVAMTEWDYAFDSFAELDGDIYAADATGLYKLGGDTDNTVHIDAVIQTGLDDAGVSNQKQSDGWFVALRSDGVCKLQIIADDVVDTAIHDLRNTNDSIRERRGMTERGPRGRYLGAKITNLDGADFRIVSIGILAKSIFRRYSNQNA